jgi:hypothetical protein
MDEPIREIEGTWEEIVTHSKRFAGRRVRLTLLDTSEGKDGIVIPERPEPTSEQMVLGIRPAAIGSGTYEGIMHIVRTLSVLQDEDNDLMEVLSEA